MQEKLKIEDIDETETLTRELLIFVAEKKPTALVALESTMSLLLTLANKLDIDGLTFIKMINLMGSKYLTDRDENE